MGIISTLGVLRGELFPTEIRATANSIVIAMGKLILVANQKIFPMAIASFGFHYVVYFFSFIMAIMVTWGFLTIKDTDKLSLTEIQDTCKDAEQKKEGEEETKAVNEKIFKATEVVQADKIAMCLVLKISPFRL